MDKINFIIYYKNSIEKNLHDPERIFHCLKKLQNVSINVKDLEQTKIGVTVNALRNFSGQVGQLASALVALWKERVNQEPNKEYKQPVSEQKEEREQSVCELQVKEEDLQESSPSNKTHHSSSKSSSSSKDKSDKKKSHSSKGSSHNHHHSSSSSHKDGSNHKKRDSSSPKEVSDHKSSSSHKHSSSEKSRSSHKHSSEHKNRSSHLEQHKEKEKKSSESKSSSDSGKHHKSHHSSHKSSPPTSSSSHKRSHEDAESKENESKSKKMKAENDKNGSDKNHEKTNKHNKEFKEEKMNGTNSKPIKSEKTSSLKRKHADDQPEEIDGTQGMGFAEALAAFDMPTSSKHRKKDQLADKIKTIPIKPSSSSSSMEKAKKQSSSVPSTSDSRPSTSSAEFKKPMTKNLTHPPMLLTQKPKQDLSFDIVNELPNDVTVPEYRPTPIINPETLKLKVAMEALNEKNNLNTSDYTSSYIMPSRPVKQPTESELLVQSFSSKANTRTRVFSGNSRTNTKVPSLYDLCIRVLQIHIDDIECTGGVPYLVLQPVLERARPDQLFNIEHFNPYLLEDTGDLWKAICQRKWKNMVPEEMETYRDMYMRVTREQAEKLSSLTDKINTKKMITSKGIQKTKLAFVDVVAKAPRGVQKKQEQFGTKNKLVASPAARVEALRNVQPNLAAPGDVRLRVSAGLRDDAQQVRNAPRANQSKPAPMMAKCIQRMKR